MLDLSTLLTPALAFAGALLGVALNRRGAHELERRSVREETMRNLRWASELAVLEDTRRSSLGLTQLRALRRSELLDSYELLMVEAALDTVIEDVEAAEEA